MNRDYTKGELDSSAGDKFERRNSERFRGFNCKSAIALSYIMRGF